MRHFSFKAFGFSIVTLLTCSLSAQTTTRSSLKSNGEIIYNLKQENANSLGELFSEGNFYGRLRNNNFLLSIDSSVFEHITDGSVSKPVSGVGASLIYKSAFYHGFDFNVGLYASYSFFHENDFLSITGVKGRDTFSRFNYANYGEQYMAVLGQANIGYTLSQTKLTAGRQLLETFYTRSNDTKMIPNTFDGVTLLSTDIPDTKLTLAYLAKQKLRDHTESHALLMYGDANSSSTINPQWSENDDSAMHRGLTYTALQAAGKPTDAPLLVADMRNNSIKNLKLNLAGYIVPELLSQAMIELNYTLPFEGISITPAIRYIKQFDNGAGAVGGASLLGNAVSTVGTTSPYYKDPNSLEAQMIAARVITKIDDWTLNLAYTNILDEADLVTPWRGFPTSGYTRSMGIYNWTANTKSYRALISKGGNTPGDYTNTLYIFSTLYIDQDEKKNLTDSMYYFGAIVKNLESHPEFQYRVRLGYRDFLDSPSLIKNYLDSRLEFNYLF